MKTGYNFIRIIGFVIILLCSVYSIGFSQEKLTSTESEVRLLSPYFEDLSDSIINGVRVKEIGYPNLDSINISSYGEWFYFFIKDNCFFTMFRPENEEARLAHISCLERTGKKISDTEWEKDTPHGKISISMAIDEHGYQFDYSLKKEEEE